MLLVASYVISILITMLFFYVDLKIQNPDITDTDRIQAIKRVHLKMNPVVFISLFGILCLYFLL